jgi:hypothetical protein
MRNTSDRFMLFVRDASRKVSVVARFEICPNSKPGRAVGPHDRVCV